MTITKTMPKAKDEEFEALKAIVRALEPLSKEAQRRILDYLIARYVRDSDSASGETP